MAAFHPARTTRAVAFDLWGTLVPFPAGTMEDVLARIAEALDAPYDELAELWRQTWPERGTCDLGIYLQNVCARLGLQPSEKQLSNALCIRLDAHARIFSPRPDAEPTLRQLRALHISTGVVTNCSSEVPELWARSPLAGLVDTTVFSCRERLMKPDPRIYRLAASRLGVEPVDCLYVGDGADEELEGARATGMTAALLRPGDTTPPPQWDGPTLTSLLEVPRLLQPAPPTATQV